MSDDKSKVGHPDRDLISLKEAYEVRNWCGSLNCTEADLRAGVAAVGHSASAVRAWLSKNKKR